MDGRPVSICEAHAFISGRTTRGERSMARVVCTPGVAAPHFCVRRPSMRADRLDPLKGGVPVAFSAAFTTCARGPLEVVQQSPSPEMRRRLSRALAAGGAFECRGERVVPRRIGDFGVDALESLVADAVDLASRLARDDGRAAA